MSRLGIPGGFSAPRTPHAPPHPCPCRSQSRSLSKHALSLWQTLSPRRPRKLIHHTEVSAWELLPDNPGLSWPVWGVWVWGWSSSCFVLLHLISPWAVVSAFFCPIISHSPTLSLRFTPREILIGQCDVRRWKRSGRCSGTCHSSPESGTLGPEGDPWA